MSPRELPSGSSAAIKMRRRVEARDGGHTQTYYDREGEGK